MSFAAKQILLRGSASIERIDESRLLQQQDAQKREQWQSMGLLERLGHAPIDPAVTAANRRKWGIKGR